jgi:cyanophycinase-like exopeptidase
MDDRCRDSYDALMCDHHRRCDTFAASEYDAVGRQRRAATIISCAWARVRAAETSSSSRASGTDAYNPYIYDLCSCDCVATIVFKNRNASFNQFVINTIRNAEAVFIAGGDQSDYVELWKGTPIEEAIHQVAAEPAPVGGTSAGMAIMSEFVYSAMSRLSGF